jgi:hypothetical protein
VYAVGCGCFGLQVIAKVRSYVDDINAHPDSLVQGQHGPYSR